MFVMSRLRLLVAAVIVGPALAALLALVAFSSTAQADHAWRDYHWARDTSDPFTLKLGDNVSSLYDPLLSATSTDWSKSTVLDTKIEAGGTSPKNCRPTPGRVEVCNERYGYKQWIGLAQIWVTGGHITQGIAKMNDSYLNNPRWYPSLNNDTARQHVVCQEVGHTLGLDHQDDSSSCMDHNLDNTQPNNHDYQQLQTIYAHLDGTSTVSSTSAASRVPPAADPDDLNSEPEWGKKIKDSGKIEVWERALPRGVKLITFVKRP